MGERPGIFRLLTERQVPQPAAEGSDDEEESSEFAGKRDLSVKTVSGDIEVSGWAEELDNKLSGLGYIS